MKYDYEYTIMPFGKYKGTYIKAIPDSYIEWCINNIEDEGLVEMFKNEYMRRHRYKKHQK